MKKTIIIICIFIFAIVGIYQLGFGIGFGGGEKKGIESVELQWERYDRTYGKIIDKAIDEWCEAKDKESYERREQAYSGIECLNWYMEKVYQQAIEEGFLTN